MASSRVVLIAAPDLQAPLRSRIGQADVMTFADADVPGALSAIVSEKPGRVVLERLFAATARGAALIARLREDAALSRVAVEVLAHDSEYRRVISPGALPSPAPASKPDQDPAPALDQRGTRRGPRTVIAPPVEITVDGSPAQLIDLSVHGAQVTSTMVLKPGQRVRVILPDDARTVRMSATVAWARFELPSGGRGSAQYRAGVEFSSPDAAALTAFAERHAAAPTSASGKPAGEL